MARFRELISAFSAGEISPRLHARTDIEQFRQACEEVTNMYVYPQGGVSRRPGSQYLSNAYTTATAAKNVPFVKSKTESYVIVFTTAATDFGLKIWDVTNKAYLTIDTTSFDAYFGGSLSKWDGYDTAAELQEIQYKQFGNAIFFAQKDHPPFALDFASVATDGKVYVTPFWAYSKIGQRDYLGALITLSNDDIANAWPYQDRNGVATSTISSTATTGNVTLNGDANVFSSGQIGSLIRITGPGALTTGVAIIKTVSDPAVASATIIRTFESTADSANWSFSSWSDALGWPKAITFFENRVNYGYTTTEPNVVWSSKTGDLSYMRQEQYIDETPFAVTNADAWSFRIPGGEFNIIQWLVGGKTFFIGTLGAEYVGFGPDATLALGPLNFNFSSETAYGSTLVQPVRRDNVIIFVQRSGRMVRELVFNFDEQSYKAPKVMTLAEHMPRKTQDLVPDTAVSNGQIVEVFHQESDSQITWYRDSNGGIFGMTRDREVDGQPTAFHYHQIAGTTVDTPGARILSGCICPSADGSHDDIYLSVRRAWDSGPDRTYLEKIGREYEHDNIYAPLFTEIEDKPVYLDSCVLSLQDPPVTVHSGFSHLYNYGGVVHVVADGNYVGPKTVNASGQITLDVAAGEVLAGMQYRSQVIPVQLNAGSVIGTSQAADRTADQITLKFLNTIGAKLGFAFGGKIDESQMFDVEFRDEEAGQDDPVELFSGEKELSPPLGYHTKINVVVRQDLPFPQHLTSIVTRGLTND